MHLGTEECTKALLRYRKETECNDIDNITLDILLNPIESEYLILIDNFLSKYDEKEHNEILNKINQKAKEIYEELGIEQIPDDCMTNNNRINTYSRTLTNYINFCTNKILRDYEVISLEEYIETIEELITGFNKGYLNNLKKEN